jgi:hypothetical protein
MKVILHGCPVILDARVMVMVKVAMVSQWGLLPGPSFPVIQRYPTDYQLSRNSSVGASAFGAWAQSDY